MERHAIFYNKTNRHIFKKLLPLLKETKKLNALGSFTKCSNKNSIGYHFEIKRVGSFLDKQVVGEFDIVIDATCLNDPIIEWFDELCNQPVINYISNKLNKKMVIIPKLKPDCNQDFDEKIRNKFLESFITR